MFEIGIQVERYMNSGSFFAEYLDEGREIIDRLATGFHFQIYLGRVEDQCCSGKRFPASLSLSNDSEKGGEGKRGQGGRLKNLLQFTNVEADMAISAFHFRACLSLLSTKLRG